MGSSAPGSRCRPRAAQRHALGTGHGQARPRASVLCVLGLMMRFEEMRGSHSTAFQPSHRPAYVCACVRARVCLVGTGVAVVANLKGDDERERVVARLAVLGARAVVRDLLAGADPPSRARARAHLRNGGCGMVSRAARYPARHGIPHGTVSRTAWYHARHGIPRGPRAVAALEVRSRGCGVRRRGCAGTRKVKRSGAGASEGDLRVEERAHALVVQRRLLLEVDDVDRVPALRSVQRDATGGGEARRGDKTTRNANGREATATDRDA